MEPEARPYRKPYLTSYGGLDFQHKEPAMARTVSLPTLSAEGADAELPPWDARTPPTRRAAAPCSPSVYSPFAYREQRSRTMQRAAKLRQLQSRTVFTPIKITLPSDIEKAYFGVPI